MFLFQAVLALECDHQTLSLDQLACLSGLPVSELPALLVKQLHFRKLLYLDRKHYQCHIVTGNIQHPVLVVTIVFYSH